MASGRNLFHRAELNILAAKIMVAGHCAGNAGDAGGSFTYFTNIYKLKLLKLNQYKLGLSC